jgi:hypothetical protein
MKLDFTEIERAKEIQKMLQNREILHLDIYCRSSKKGFRIQMTSNVRGRLKFT